jgi:myo-inositol-1(or 4)-monophosphatase
VSTDYDLLRTATRAALAGAHHVRTIRRPEAAQWRLKGKSDFVSRADLETEEIVVEVLRRDFPESAVLGEELSPTGGGAELLWVVDPIDGTTNFLHDYPAYAVSVAAVVDDQPAAGVIVDVARNVVSHAVRGGGAWQGERQLHVSTIDLPANALIGTGFPFKVPGLLPAYLRQFTTVLQQTSGIRRAGAASLDFVDLAAGRFDGFWELQLAPWDVAAGMLIVREAGGHVTDLEGSDATPCHGAFVAGNPAIHAWLLEVLQE